MARKDFDRVREIREKANERRRLEQRAAKRKAILLQGALIVGVLVVVGAIIAVIVFTNNNKVPQAVPQASGTTTIGGASGIPLVIGGTSVSVGQKDAPVTLDVYEDYSCPSCANYEAQVGTTIDKLIADGDVIVNYHPIRFVTNYGQTAGAAAACVATEDPESWPKIHTGLFASHDQTSDRWKVSDFITFAKAGGVTNTAALECIKSGMYSDWITSNTNTAQERGVERTPTLLLNGKAFEELPSAEQLVAAVAEAKQG